LPAAAEAEYPHRGGEDGELLRNFGGVAEQPCEGDGAAHDGATGKRQLKIWMTGGVTPDAQQNEVRKSVVAAGSAGHEMVYVRFAGPWQLAAVTASVLVAL